MNNVWLGSIFIKNEGGYEILISALKHYKKRLRNIASSPELQDAPMFKQVVEQEAMKTYPHIDVLIKKINHGLINSEKLHDIEQDIPILEKSLQNYSSDLQKANIARTNESRADKRPRRAAEAAASTKASVGTTASKKAAHDKVNDNVSQKVKDNLTGSTMKAGSGVGVGSGGQDYFGPMNKGGLIARPKKKTKKKKK